MILLVLDYNHYTLSMYLIIQFTLYLDIVFFAHLIDNIFTVLHVSIWKPMVIYNQIACNRIKIIAVINSICPIINIRYMYYYL